MCKPRTQWLIDVVSRTWLAARRWIKFHVLLCGSVTCYLAFIGAFSGLAQEQPILKIVKTESPPIIDGELTDLCWQKAATAAEFKLLGSDKLASQQTKAYLLHDDRCLYLAFECFEDKMDKLEAKMTKYDDRVWEEDSVEIFLDIELERQTYYHFIISALGTKYDEYTLDAKWNANWEAKTKKFADFWTLEVAIPFDQFPITPKVGNTWGINFCRQERPHSELSTWAYLPGSSFHQPKYFGLLTNLEVDFTALCLKSLKASLSKSAEHLEKIENCLPKGSQGHKLVNSLNDEIKEIKRDLQNLKGNINTPERQKDHLKGWFEAMERLELKTDKISAQMGKLQMLQMLPKNLQQNAEYLVCYENNMTKIRKDKPYQGKPVTEVRIYAAKNEYEGFQLVLVPLGKDLEDVKVSVSDLRAQDKKIKSKNITINIVGYVEIKKPSASAEEGVGWFPDPLLENRKFSLNAEEIQPLWFTIYVPSKAATGNYSGFIYIEPKNARGTKIELKLKVWNFALPVRTNLRNWFQIMPGYLNKFYKFPTVPNVPSGWIYSIWTGADARGIENYFGKGVFINELDKKEKHSGKRAIKIIGKEAIKGDYESPRAAFYTQPIALKPDTDYLFSVWYKTENLSDNQAVVYTELFNLSLQSSSNWTQRTFKFNSKDAKEMRIYLQNWGVGTVWYDDVFLGEAKEGVENLAPNSGFEEGDYEQGIELIRKFRLNALAHRCSDLNIASPKVEISQEGKVKIDWTDFDEEIEFYIKHGLTGFNVNWARLPGGWGRVEEVKDKKEIEIAKDILRQTQEHLKTKDWLDLAYVYVIDEPSRDFFPQVKAAFKIVKEAAPKLKTLLTYGYGATRPWKPGEPGLPAYADLVGYVDIHVPHIDCFHPEFMKERQEKGEEIWEYICISASHPYPNIWAIDYPGIEHRICFWQLWRYNITGFLYWAINYWEKNVWEDTESYPGGNGDGSLIYPGVEGPVNSIRWEIIRDGIEDYDYLWILKDLVTKLEQTSRVKKNRKLISGAESLLDIKEITSTFTEYTKDTQKLSQRRMEIGNLIEKIRESI